MAMTVTSSSLAGSAQHSTVQPGTVLGAMSSHALPVRNRPTSTADLLRAVARGEEGFDLVPVGISLHSFTDPAREHTDLPLATLHCATAVLTKQVLRVLRDPHPLAAIQRLVTDPARVALADGRTVATLCGDAWPRIRSIADDRAVAAVDGAVAFGEPAILRLAATRAALPTCPWWGTRGWAELVERWASDHRSARRSVTALLRSPETADQEILGSILDR
jgi:hypothetical protein